MKTKFLIYAWRHAILHDVSLVEINRQNIFHFRSFRCVIYVQIAPPQCTKIEPQRRLGVYVSFVSPSIIRYLKPLTGDIFKARFEDCHFDENIFSSLRKEKSLPKARQ
jgi:hypothetical protein